jgi:hypothetical protein
MLHTEKKELAGNFCTGITASDTSHPEVRLIHKSLFSMMLDGAD